jgi:hypothetical protein
VKRQFETNESALNVSPWTTQVLKKELSRKKPDSEHILISDLTRGFTRPNIVDIKLGTLHHSQARATLKPTKYQTAVSLGYCIAAGAAVALADGTARRIELVDDLAAAMVASPAATTQRLEFARCDAAFASGLKRCVRLTLADGRTLECTPDHRLLAADGCFVAARDIKPHATRLAVAPLIAVLDEPSADELDFVCQLTDDIELRMDCRKQRACALAYARIAGRLVGSNRRAPMLSVTNALDRESLLRDMDALDALGDAVSHRSRVDVWHDGCDRLVAALDDAPGAIVREFLASLLGVSRIKFGRASMHITTEAALAERVCVLLDRCGVAAMPLACDTVAVEYDAFCERVGFRHCARAQRRAATQLIARRVARLNGTRAALYVKRGAEMSMLALAVTSVTEIGARRVFDLTVPGNATFLANGVGVHNCIGGMMVWNEKMSSYHHIDKYVGRTLTDATIGGMLELFFAPDSRMHIKALIPTIRKLSRLLKFFEEQVAWRFHSTSLLVIYEGSPHHHHHHAASATSTTPTAAAGGDTEQRVSVGLVDFAHAYMNHPGIEGRQPQVDAGCKLGIGNLITLFEQFAARTTLRVKRVKAQWSSTIKWLTAAAPADDETGNNSAHSTNDAETDASSGDESSSVEPDEIDTDETTKRRTNSVSLVQRVPSTVVAPRKRSSSEQIVDVKRLSLLDSLEKRESGSLEDVEPFENERRASTSHQQQQQQQPQQSTTKQQKQIV